MSGHIPLEYVWLACLIVSLCSFASCLRRRVPRPQVAQMGQPYHVRWNPEILRLVISELSSRDQARMALVCHLFWEVTIPVLWRSLPLDQTNRHITHLVPQSVIEFLGGRHIRLAQVCMHYVCHA